MSKLLLTRTQIISRCNMKIKHEKQMIEHDEMHHSWGTKERIQNRKVDVHFYESILGLIKQLKEDKTRLEQEIPRPPEGF